MNPSRLIRRIFRDSVRMYFAPMGGFIKGWLAAGGDFDQDVGA